MDRGAGDAGQPLAPGAARGLFGRRGGYCFSTLHDAVEFFNLVLELALTKEEKADLVAFLLCL